jgi:hypothetical protein
MYYKQKQIEYLEFAINCVNATSSMNLSERQRRGMTLFFMPIAKRFGLIKEFRDIGVI